MYSDNSALTSQYEYSCGDGHVTYQGILAIVNNTVDNIGRIKILLVQFRRLFGEFYGPQLSRLDDFMALKHYGH